MWQLPLHADTAVSTVGHTKRQRAIPEERNFHHVLLAPARDEVLVGRLVGFATRK